LSWKRVEYGNLIIMPENGRRDLIRRLKVNGYGLCSLWGKSWILLRNLDGKLRKNFYLLKKKSTGHAGTADRIRVRESYTIGMKSVWIRNVATGQSDQGFSGFCSVLEQKLSSYPTATLHCVLSIQHILHYFQNFFTNTALPLCQTEFHKIQNSDQMLNLLPMLHT